MIEQDNKELSPLPPVISRNTTGSEVGSYCVIIRQPQEMFMIKNFVNAKEFP